MEEGLTEPDKEAAQQLVQLSGGDEEQESKRLGYDDNRKKEKEKEKKEGMKAEISERGMEEEEDEHRSRKRQRFRSLASIYKSTEPVSTDHHGSRKKRRRRGKEKASGA